MDTKEHLAILESGQPLFDTIPSIRHPRIYGTESEYGVVTLRRFDSKFMYNGGLMLVDGEHPEYSTPETSNPLSATLYYEAGKSIFAELGISTELFCNNNSWHSDNEKLPESVETFGSHENYSTCRGEVEWFSLIPFLIARTVICGNGWINKSGKFGLSQRAPFIQNTIRFLETSPRSLSLVDAKGENLAGIEKCYRIHVTGGDATMNEVATFLRLGMTGLVIEMLEMDMLPDVLYFESHALDDLRMISANTDSRHWIMNGLRGKTRDVLDLLERYRAMAFSLFSNRDAPTDLVLCLWKDTLEKLGRDPMLLRGRLDWVAKLCLFEKMQEAEPEVSHDLLRAIDLEYHRIQPQNGLYHYLRDENTEFVTERLFTPQLINHAREFPPMDTRAYARGTITRLISERSSRFYNTTSCDWTKIIIADNSKVKPSTCLDIGNPFFTYTKYVESIQGQLAMLSK